MRDLYTVLGVARDAPDDAIKSAFRKLALKYHPDKSPGKLSEDKFKEVSHAYSILHDVAKRAHYDRYGEEEMPEAAPPPRPRRKRGQSAPKPGEPVDGGPSNLLGDLYKAFMNFKAMAPK